MDAFYRGLSDRIKDALPTHDPSTDLQSLMDLVTRLDGRFRERQLERNRSSRPSRPTITSSHPSSWRTPEPKLSPSPSREEPEPMQLGRSRLTPEERERRFRDNLCLYCGASGHKALSCPLKGRGPSALHRLSWSQCLFVKAEKCLFHVPTVSFLGFIISAGQVQMDPTKVQAVALWPTPENRKQVQRFLGFANFYRKFIRNFSTIAAPLHRITSAKVRFTWSPEAQQAFQSLKDSFCSAPILTLPDPKLQFILEVDASDTGAGAVLSQRSVSDQRLHPCAFFSRRLTKAERNYSIGDRELLAGKLALEEWRHWLEGASQPFQVLTDHKNLEYLWTAKRLNPRQARWALFFDRFQFSLSYLPGTKNGKADALSRLHNPSTVTEEPAFVLPHSARLGAARLDIEQEGLLGPALSCNVGFGGLPCGQMSESTSLPVLTVPRINPPTDVLLVCFAPFLFHSAHGHTSLWTSLLACHPSRA
ncbi:uncharacterized protein LOC113154109 [Anabas testudineus]|uniref:uncharacterized protein LOC113154109 n=1 Tax=Anabas testudineus TaxID=64144 RepID=UPI000E45B2D9|nr:uncharacterized protein LOC113154109 [Anabas testudineus]